MTEEQRTVYTLGLLLQAEILMQGMIAENKQRKLQGEAMAYVHADFHNLIDEYGVCHNALIVNLTGH